MTKNQFYTKVEDLLEVAPGSITGSEPLNGMDGWDSLAVLSFIAMADEECGTTISAQQLTACKTVADLAGLLPGIVDTN